MTDEEKAEEWLDERYLKDMGVRNPCKKGFLAGLEYNNKQIAELKEKISVLLSCKNCPENKGGWICVKEYENKCLAQKIEFIKELEKEKCELLGIIQGKDKVIQELKEELNKANEWHYPSKGEYPEEREDVLCYCKVVGVKFYNVGHTIIGGDNKIRWWSSNRIEELKVYAWKEITSPKEVTE